MQWTQVRQMIRTQIRPGKTAILKCDGIERRPVTSNRAEKIVGMKTGVQTRAPLSLEMSNASPDLFSPGRGGTVKDYSLVCDAVPRPRVDYVFMVQPRLFDALDMLSALPVRIPLMRNLQGSGAAGTG